MTAAQGRLFVVATPIGNLEDLSPRAVATLRRAAAIYCEDTRVTGKLASRFGIASPRYSCHEHNEASRIPEALARLREGRDIALVSDAGPPAISDPGRRLVAAAAREGFAVIAVPGPSALAAALSLSGLPAVPHTFLGFPPGRAGERRKWLEAQRDRSETIVFFEAPHRLAACLAQAAEVLGNRPATVSREMTKVHEEVLRGTLPELAAEIGRRERVRGECVIVVGGSEPGAAADPAEDWRLEAGRLAGTGATAREVAREIHRRSGVPSREVYRYVASLRTRERG